MADSPRVESRPLRVLCCSGSLEGGGSERQLWQLASKLDRSRFAPAIYLLYPRGHYIDLLPKDLKVTSFWSEYDESQRYWPGQIRRLQIRHLAKIIREQQIDVVYDRTFHMTLVTAAAARQAGVPRISVIVSPPSADFQKSRERFRFFKKRLLAAAYRERGCVTIAVSREVAEDAADFYGLHLPDIRVLPNPVDIDAVRAAAGASTLSEGGGDAPPRIAVVGRLSKEKGQRWAIEAIKIANSSGPQKINLDIVGDGPDRKKLEDLADSLGVNEAVTFHGFLPNPYPLIRRAKLLCIPSEHEGLPNVALEAMALGTPILATDCSGSVRTLIGDNERGVLVARGDALQLANEMRRICNGMSQSGVDRCAATAWVERHHAMDSWMRQMEHLFANVVKAPFVKIDLELD